MNFSRVNGAVVNGAALVAVLSSALAVGIGTAWAGATIIRPAQSAYGITVTTQAIGVREVRGTATVMPSVVCSAEWSIAKDAGAMIRVTAVARASYSDVTAVVASSGAANGTLIQGALSKANAASTATAKADRKAGAEAVAVSTFLSDVSTSIKRSGQSTTEREGFVSGITYITVTALGEKTMLSYAVGGATSAGTATSTHQQGGMAVVSINSLATALGASDTAYSTTYTNATAKPTHTQLVEEAKASTSCSVTVPASRVERPGAALFVTGASATADGRIATLAYATGMASSMGAAAGRLALQGQAFGASTNDGHATSTATRPAAASGVVIAEVIAMGTRTCMGESAYLVKFSPRVDAISNPAIPAPFARTMRVPAEDRAMRVPYENREMRVA